MSARLAMWLDPFGSMVPIAKTRADKLFFFIYWICHFKALSCVQIKQNVMIHIYITRNYYNDFTHKVKSYKSTKMVNSIIEMNDYLLHLETCLYRDKKLNVSTSIEIKTDNPVNLGEYETC